MPDSESEHADEGDKEPDNQDDDINSISESRVPLNINAIANLNSNSLPQGNRNLPVGAITGSTGETQDANGFYSPSNDRSQCQQQQTEYFNLASDNSRSDSGGILITATSTIQNQFSIATPQQSLTPIEQLQSQKNRIDILSDDHNYIEDESNSNIESDKFNDLNYLSPQNINQSLQQSDLYCKQGIPLLTPVRLVPRLKKTQSLSRSGFQYQESPLKFRNDLESFKTPLKTHKSTRKSQNSDSSSSIRKTKSISKIPKPRQPQSSTNSQKSWFDRFLYSNDSVPDQTDADQQQGNNNSNASLAAQSQWQSSNLQQIPSGIPSQVQHTQSQPNSRANSEVSQQTSQQSQIQQQQSHIPESDLTNLDSSVQYSLAGTITDFFQNISGLLQLGSGDNQTHSQVPQSQQQSQSKANSKPVPKIKSQSNVDNYKSWSKIKPKLKAIAKLKPNQKKTPKKKAGINQKGQQQLPHPLSMQDPNSIALNSNVASNIISTSNQLQRQMMQQLQQYGPGQTPVALTAGGGHGEHQIQQQSDYSDPQAQLLQQQGVTAHKNRGHSDHHDSQLEQKDRGSKEVMSQTGHEQTQQQYQQDTEIQTDEYGQPVEEQDQQQQDQQYPTSESLRQKGPKKPKSSEEYSSSDWQQYGSSDYDIDSQSQYDSEMFKDQYDEFHDSHSRHPSTGV